MNPRMSTPRNILNKMAKIKDKDRILKAAREKQTVMYKVNSIMLLGDFSAEVMQARRQWYNTFQVFKGKNPTSKNNLTSEIIIQNWRNKEFSR